MGNQPARQGKRFRVYLAGCLLTVLLLGSCTYTTPPGREVEQPTTALRHLARGECLLIRGDYRGTRRHAEHVLSKLPGEADDQALYLLGLALFHPDNPERDAHGAVVAFQRIVAEYPHSTRVADARTWLAVTARLEKCEDTLARLEERLTASEKKLAEERQRRTQLAERLQQMKDVDLTVE